MFFILNKLFKKLNEIKNNELVANNQIRFSDPEPWQTVSDIYDQQHYLREFRTKLQSRLEHLKQVEASADASKAEKTRALKEIEALKKTIDELDAYERDTLYPLATQQIQIDLDDGVKVNYPKFGAALKKIPGLEGKEEGGF